MRTARAIVPVGFAVLALAACGGGGGGKPAAASEPSEAPQAAMKRLLRLEFGGMHLRAWRMLVREQRAAIKRGLFLACQEPGLANVTIEVLDARDEDFDVPALGKTRTKALRWTATVRPPVGDEFVLRRTGHLIPEDGAWRWTLSKETFRAYSRGACA